MVEAMRPSADAVLERFAKSLCCIVEAEPLPRLDIIPRRPALLDMGPGGAHDKTLPRKQFLDAYDAGHASEPVDPGEHASERSEEHTSELQSLVRLSYPVCCLNQEDRRADQKFHERRGQRPDQKA